MSTGAASSPAIAACPARFGARPRRSRAAPRRSQPASRRSQPASRRSLALPGDRGHGDVGQAAGNHPGERLEVIAGVEGEAVGRHTPGHVDADRGDLAVLDPDARVIRPLLVAGAGAQAFIGERGDQGSFDPSQVQSNVGDRHDGVADQLARAVTGEFAPALDVDQLDVARRGRRPGSGSSAARDGPG